MHSSETRESAARLRADGLTIPDVARALDVSRSTLRSWETAAEGAPAGGRSAERYDYPRCQFSNVSEDILALRGWALALVGVPWRRSSAQHVSVSRRDGVARLDDLISLKA